MSNIAVIGIGAMGGGIARALLESEVSSTVSPYDLSTSLVKSFMQEAIKLEKSGSKQTPTKLSHVVTHDTQFTVIVLLNEQQCQSVCFGGEENLLALMPRGSCVIVSSTVTASWIRKAQKKFEVAGVHFVDCPTSGGPTRARAGTLCLMASGDKKSLELSRPLLDVMGAEVHIIAGGPGMGSTVKMVHQLLAGIHITAAAEALALAAKAGLDVEQVYEIVNGAAGASWMFSDRGQRMLASSPPCKSQGQIFVKDMDICHAEAKRLQCPIPVASAALQQFISAQSMGLGTQDDSQVVQVYEAISGVPVARTRQQGQHQSVKSEGTNVGDTWMGEEILEVGCEPRHQVVLKNEYVRAIRVAFPTNDTTAAHRHSQDSLYFFLVEGGLDVVNHVQGDEPVCDCMDFGEVRFGGHKESQPLVHRITNKSNQEMLCIDAELLARPPVTAAIPLVASNHELIKTRGCCRVYKLSLEPDESVTTSYCFFHLCVVLLGGVLRKETVHNVRWTESFVRGDLTWSQPVSEITKTNIGTSTYVEYIAEWR